jgi:hypothetical protein
MPSENPVVDPRAQRAAEIGRAVAAHINSGAHDDESIWAAHWHPEFESLEGDGSAWKGIDKVREKCQWWMSKFEVHSCKAEGPFVTPNGFALKLDMEIEAKDGSMPKTAFSEVAVYTMNDGKITREEFFNTPMA